ncbi:hypothetical protein DKX38_002190 [Salix brachista]|uniref:Reticulon-like protein n=1 Tax=Salix brachista TaxID=2182728 RepID=A0A5N5NMY3_9ROSI|nr:hypothetical protein DKX38_002190 [Salix brachista]
MPEKITAEDLISNLVETIAENVPKKKSVSFFEEEEGSVTSRINRLFGRQKPVHHLLGGGKSADVLLWRNKKISSGVLTGATAIWVLFEWLNYHFLSLISFVLALGMLAQFIWINASGLLKRSPAQVPRLVLPDDIFVSIGRSVGAEVNRALQFLQDLSCGGNLKQFLVYHACVLSSNGGNAFIFLQISGQIIEEMLCVLNDLVYSVAAVVSLWVAAIIGSWCNFLTVMYIGFVAAHTLPVLYERYEDEVDDFMYKAFGQLQNNYQKFDAGVLSKIPKGKLQGKKHE